MMFFSAVYSNPSLAVICKQTCEENAAYVDISESLIKNGMLDDDKVLILKPDAYYSSSNMHNPPPAIDCMVFVKCESGFYDVYLIELRTCTGTKRISISDILPKFKTISDTFIPEFPEVFDQLAGKVRSLELWLVVDPFRTSGLNADAVQKKILGTVVEQYSLMKPVVLFGKTAVIKPQLPYREYPHPVIKDC